MDYGHERILFCVNKSVEHTKNETMQYHIKYSYLLL